MFRPRVIPVLLLSGRTLVKSRQFQDFRYIGDPINAVRLFNEMKADELAFLDILATKENRPPSLELVKGIGEEASMPFAVGGGIRTIEDVRRVIGAGAEKVIINTAAVENPDFIKQASETFGASTIVVCLDVKRTPSGEERVWS
ncbi:MAG: HisA/HisF-related TIM barrel protein, partial [Bdellovibrionota bacterium]